MGSLIALQRNMCVEWLEGWFLHEFAGKSVAFVLLHVPHEGGGGER